MMSVAPRELARQARPDRGGRDADRAADRGFPDRYRVQHRGDVRQCADRAWTLSEPRRFDLAILDVNLAGEMAYPVADLLAERNIPFLLLSGYGTEAIPSDHPEWKVCAKPFKGEELVKMLLAVLGPAKR